MKLKDLKTKPELINCVTENDTDHHLSTPEIVNTIVKDIGASESLRLVQEVLRRDRFPKKRALVRFNENSGGKPPEREDCIFLQPYDDKPLPFTKVCSLKFKVYIQALIIPHPELDKNAEIYYSFSTLDEQAEGFLEEFFKVLNFIGFSVLDSDYNFVSDGIEILEKTKSYYEFEVIFKDFDPSDIGGKIESFFLFLRLLSSLKVELISYDLVS